MCPGWIRCSASLLACAWVAVIARPLRAADGDAQASDLERAVAEQEARADGWGFEEMRYFFGFFWQEGHGLQSQAGPVTGRGSEDAWIIEPMASFRFRTNRQLKHEVVFPIDIVTAASPDALDAVSSASATNQAVSLDINSVYSTEIVDFGFRWGPHFEETLRSFFAGPSLTFRFLEDNTVIGLSGYIVADAFDPIRPDGRDAGQDTRISLNGNFSLTQVLSATTLFGFDFGVTTQSGILQNTWNSVITYDAAATEGPPVYRVAEVFPENRFRSASVLRLSQHIPATHTTVKGSYRFYADENQVFANTGQVEIFQYIVPWLYVRGHGRLHVQPAIDFWVPSLATPPDSGTPRTSDSDLEAFVSREAGLKVVVLRSRAPLEFRSNDSFDVSYLHYERSNDLRVDFASLGYARTF